MKTFCALLALITLSVLQSGSSLAQDTATLKARFVLEGKEEPKAIPIKNKGRDPFCAALDLKYKPIELGKDGGIKYLALYIYERGTDIDLPEVAVDDKAEIVLDNNGCMFSPPVLKARAGQTITVTNSDQCGHNANFNFLNNAGVNPLIAQGGSAEVKIEVSEPAPIEVNCSIHPWMKAHIIITEHPFVGISDDNGEIVIEGLPVGKVTFKAWHQYSIKSIDEVTIDGEAESWRRGRFEVDLKPGENDLGTIVVSPDLFELE